MLIPTTIEISGWSGREGAGSGKNENIDSFVKVSGAVSNFGQNPHFQGDFGCEK